MTNNISQAALAIALAAIPLTTFAKPLQNETYKELKAEAEQQGQINVIVTLGNNQPIGEMLAALKNNPQPAEPQSYTAMQEAFMSKLGEKGVLDAKFFDESPSIQLKLNEEGLKRVLKIKEVVNIVPAFDGSAL